LIIAKQGLKKWDQDRVRGLRPVFIRQLLDLGVIKSEIETGADLVQEALENTLGHDIGRWIVSAHQEGKNEYAVSGIDQGRVVSVVMDRTFVDETGVRWIIDYKTSRHEGTQREGFLDQEKFRYQAQMEIYARLLQAGEHRSIKLGLYFPLLSGWREWSFWP
jgi:hypothetical protein